MVTRANQPVSQQTTKPGQGGQPAEGFEHLQETINAVQACQNACTQFATHLRDLGGRHTDPSRIRVILDCADVCQLAANTMMRGTARYADIAELCAKFCLDAAEECARMPEDSGAKDCQQAARQAYDACRRIGQADPQSSDAAKAQPRR